MAPANAPESRNFTPTRAQLEVLELMAAGLPIAEIAQRIHRSVRTVESHRYQLGKKLGARSQLDLVARARRLGFIRDGSATPAHDIVDEPIGWAESMLRLESSIACNDPGRPAMEAGFARLGLHLQACAVFYSRNIMADQMHIIACWSRSGSLRGVQWTCERNVWPIAALGTLHHMDETSIPTSLRQALQQRLGDFSRCSFTPIFLGNAYRGCFCVVTPRDVLMNARDEALIRVTASLVSREVGYLDGLHHREILKTMIELLEQASEFLCLMIDPIREFVELSPLVAKALGCGEPGPFMRLEHICSVLTQQSADLLRVAIRTFDSCESRINLRVQLSPLGLGRTYLVRGSLVHNQATGEPSWALLMRAVEPDT